MTKIPKIYQYYPQIPLSDLSDLYSVGNNRIGQKRICIISHLPKILRVGADLHITNKYTLFVEETARVDSILWDIKLYNKGELQDNPANLRLLNNKANELLVYIDSAFYSSAKEKLFDKMVINCNVKSGTENITLALEHILVSMFDIRDMTNPAPATLPDTLSEDNFSKKQFINNPRISNYLLNCLNDYFSDSDISWSRSPVLDFNDLAERENLLLTVVSIIYFTLLNNFNSEMLDAGIVNLDEFDNKNIEAHLNIIPAPAYDGNFKNGISQLPLHILNSVFTDIVKAPLFNDISESNIIFSILKNEGVIYQESYTDFYGMVPELMPSSIKDLKQKIYDDKNKLVELYNLTRFPKSSIKLTFILVKFLFECSKKNSFQECLGAGSSWLNDITGFHQIHQYPECWKNILAHYFDGPSSEIKNFATYVRGTYKLTGSPQTHLILHHPPRIVTAYFAKKVVKKTNTGLRCFFERIDSRSIRVGDDERRLINQPTFDSILGRQLYLVIETLNCRNKELICSIRSDQLTGDSSDLNLVTGPNRWAPLPINGPEFEVQSSISVFVGRHDALNNISGNHEEYINVFDRYQDSKYNIDHVDKAIVKVNLRPDNQRIFTNWANRLGAATANLEVLVKQADSESACYGNDPKLSSAAGEFLSSNDKFDNAARFRLVNRIVYEIFHRNNQRNFFALNAGGVRKRVGKTLNDFIIAIPDGSPLISIREVVFFYHDQNDNEHELCSCSFSRPPRRANGVPVAATSNPGNVQAGFTSDSDAPVGGDAFKNYYYPNGDIVTRDNPAAAGTDYGVIRYSLAIGADAGFAELVRMPNNLDTSFLLDESNRITITFAFSNTQRRFANPGCFAAFLGILAELNYQDVQSTGMCFGDATSYPSLSHPNGDSIDTRPLLQHDRRVAIIAAFRDWGFTWIISGVEDVQDGANDHNPEHSGQRAHVHAQDYNENNSVHLITN